MAITHQLLLTLEPGVFAIARFAPAENLPSEYTQSRFFSLTRTEEELSLVCEESHIPAGAKAERGRKLLRVESPLAFSLTGIIESIAAPLAEAAVSIFAVSTYDTDYLLVSAQELDRAIAALEQAGHKVHRRIPE